MQQTAAKPSQVKHGIMFASDIFAVLGGGQLFDVQYVLVEGNTPITPCMKHTTDPPSIYSDTPHT